MYHYRPKFLILTNIFSFEVPIHLYLFQQDSDVSTDHTNRQYQRYLEQSRHIWKEIEQMEAQADEMREEISDYQYSLVSQGLMASNTYEEPTQEQSEHVANLQDQVKDLVSINEK